MEEVAIRAAITAAVTVAATAPAGVTAAGVPVMQAIAVEAIVLPADVVIIRDGVLAAACIIIMAM